MADYHNLTKELQERIREDQASHWKNPYASKDADIIRRNPGHDRATLWRPAYLRDIEKIMHVPYYNRYSDKTQVFSFYQNDVSLFISELFLPRIYFLSALNIATPVCLLLSFV